MDWSIHDWSTLLAVIGAICAGVGFVAKRALDLVKEFKKLFESANKIHGSITKGQLATLHSQLFDKGGDYIRAGSITVAQLNDLDYLWDAYSELGGNGTGEMIYNKCRELPISDYSPNDNWNDVEKLAKEHEAKRNV